MLPFRRGRRGTRRSLPHDPVFTCSATCRHADGEISGTGQGRTKAAARAAAAQALLAELAGPAESAPTSRVEAVARYATSPAGVADRLLQAGCAIGYARGQFHLSLPDGWPLPGELPDLPVPAAHLLPVLARVRSQDAHPSVRAWAHLAAAVLAAVARRDVHPAVDAAGYDRWALVLPDGVLAREDGTVDEADAREFADLAAEHLLRTPGAALIAGPAPYIGRPAPLPGDVTAWADRCARLADSRPGRPLTIRLRMEDDGIIGELLPRDLGYPELRAVRRARHLRDCQGRAVAWLAGITGLGFGAVLADDMGLGKTLTIIAFHLHRSAGPALVVCPASLLTNWEREIARFAPGVPVRRHHGAARDLNSLPPDGILLTSYRTLLRDIDQFRGVCFGLVVADGAQAIKNPRGLHAAALRQLDAGLRVAVTGTPVENSLTDLWAILDFGRRQTVHVHHLIAENTVEDHIGELLRHKRAIADRLLTGDEMSLTELTDEELGQLVSLGAGGGRDQA